MSKSDTWMPLFIGDYLADTMHLRAAEHGAYLLLLMHYWRNGPLPDSGRMLASIAQVDQVEWESDVGPVVLAFFEARDGKLHQKRMDAERAKASDLSGKRRAAAHARHGRGGQQNSGDGDASGGASGMHPASKGDAIAPANGHANGGARAEQRDDQRDGAGDGEGVENASEMQALSKSDAIAPANASPDAIAPAVAMQMDPHARTCASASPSHSPSERQKDSPQSPPEPAKPRAVLSTADRPAFDVWWREYPRKTAKDRAISAYTAALRRGATTDQLLTGLRRYRFDFRDDGRFVPHPATWLNDGRWKDEAPQLLQAAGPAPTRLNTSL